MSEGYDPGSLHHDARRLSVVPSAQRASPVKGRELSIFIADMFDIMHLDSEKDKVAISLSGQREPYVTTLDHYVGPRSFPLRGFGAAALQQRGFIVSERDVQILRVPVGLEAFQPG